jgi:hypothetical protein
VGEGEGLEEGREGGRVGVRSERMLV